MSRHVVVAATEKEAEALARPNYAPWFANLTKLWRDFGAMPVRFARDFDEARQRGIAIAGTPARVREEIERQVAESGCSYFVCRLMFGGMSEPEASAAIDLFAAEVMPALSALVRPPPDPSSGGESVNGKRTAIALVMSTSCSRGPLPRPVRRPGQAGRGDALGALRDAGARLVRSRRGGRRPHAVLGAVRACTTRS